CGSLRASQDQAIRRSARLQPGWSHKRVHARLRRALAQSGVLRLGETVPHSASLHAGYECLSPSRASYFDNQLARRCDPAVVALEKESGRAKLLQDGRRGDAGAGREGVAIIDRTAHRLLGIEEIDVAMACGLRGAPLAEPREGELRALADDAEPHVHHLDGL